MQIKGIISFFATKTWRRCRRLLITGGTRSASPICSAGSLSVHVGRRQPHGTGIPCYFLRLVHHTVVVCVGFVLVSWLRTAVLAQGYTVEWLRVLTAVVDTTWYSTV